MAIAFPQPSSDTPVVNVTGGKDALVSMETAGDVTIASDTNWANKLYRVKNLTVEAGATLNTFGAVIVVESTLKVDGTIQGVPVGVRRTQTHPTPVSYTHLTLPTIYSV